MESNKENMPPWSFTIEFDEEKADRNGYDVETLYDYVGRNVEPLGNVRIARGTWKASGESNKIGAQTHAISMLSRQKWVMENVRSISCREEDSSIQDGIESIRRVFPERVID